MLTEVGLCFFSVYGMSDIWGQVTIRWNTVVMRQFWNYLNFNKATAKYSMLKVLWHFIGKNKKISGRLRIFRFYSQLQGPVISADWCSTPLGLHPLASIPWRSRVKALQIHWMSGCISSYIFTKPVVLRLVMAVSLDLNLCASLQQLHITVTVTGSYIQQMT